MSRAWRSDAPVVPGRITVALDFAEQWGPQVDAALGVEEPTVDCWESGQGVPTPAQVKRIALLTGFPERFFYRPLTTFPRTGFVCGHDGCQPTTCDQEHTRG